jgi:hypothetical protein
MPIEFRTLSDYGHTLMVGVQLPIAVQWLFDHEWTVGEFRQRHSISKFNGHGGVSARRQASSLRQRNPMTSRNHA